MITDKEDFCNRIRQGQLYLILGQKSMGTPNCFVEMVRKEYGLESCKPEYDVLLNLNDTEKIPWIQSKVNCILAPESYSVLEEFPWNGVITSCSDGIIERTLSNNWRKTIAVCKAENIIQGRLTDRSRLAVTYLFGMIGEETEGERIPLNDIEKINADANAFNLLGKYSPAVISTLGTVIIEGYDPDNDWLSIAMLLPFISKLSKGQVYYFGGSLTEKNQYWKKMVESGIITECDQSFAEFVIQLEVENLLELDELTYEHEDGNYIAINGHSYPLSKELYNSLECCAEVLNDRILLKKEINKEELQGAFRQFLYESGSGPVWDAYKSDMDFYRDKQEDIDKLINEELKSDFETNPVILEGQSGSGKSVLLGRIAYNFKIKKVYPILFISQINNNDNYREIRRFCDWAEGEHGAKRVLIFWDMSAYDDEISRYVELNNRLTSAGRKVLIIGSSLKLSGKVKNTYKCKTAELDINLSEKEAAGIVRKFNYFAAGSIDKNTLLQYGEGNFFVACYRLLPSARSTFRRGIWKETAKEKLTLKEFFNFPAAKEKNTLLYDLMINAGIHVSEEYVFGDETEAKRDKVIEMICVPAQFNLWIPLDLLLRCFDAAYNVEISKMIDEIDFFRIVEDVRGGWLVGCRSSLEADIALQNCFSDPMGQINIVTEYIHNAVLWQGYMDSGLELDFILELVKAVGPNGKKDNFYQNHYLELEEALEKAREKGVYDSRTILQEAFLLREYAKESDDKEIINSCIKKGRELVSHEIGLKKHDERINRMHLGRLYAELASNYGTELHEILKEDIVDQKYVQELYALAMKTLQVVRDYLPDSFYALDICSWISLLLLKNSAISGEFKKEVYAASMLMFEEAEFLSPELCELEEFLVRRMELDKAAGEQQLSEKSFEKLLNLGSGAGVYITARNMLTDICLNDEIGVVGKDRCKAAVKYMEKYAENIAGNARCLVYLFKLKWMSYVGHPIFWRENQLIALKNDEWVDLVKCINNVLDQNSESSNIVLKYIKAIALFHLGNLPECFRIFQEIRNIPYHFAHRIRTHYIASSEDGKARIFQGNISSLGDGKKVYFHIKGIREEIPYINAEFAAERHVVGEKHDNLELGFNFIGIQVSKEIQEGDRRNA